MSVLTEKQIEYGFNYYHNDDSHPKSVVTELESLTLKTCKEVKALYPQLIALPKLKYGTLVTRPYLYK